MINPLNPHYALENPASIYDEEAMTALELAGRTTAKVNECVEEVNQIPVKIADHTQEHIEQGTFDKQIDKHTSKLFQEIADMEREFEQNTKVFEAQLNTLLGSVHEGSTTLDAEVIDLRVDKDGKQHISAGTAVREQFRRTLQTAGKNILDASEYSDANNLPTNSVITFTFYGENENTEFANLPEGVRNGTILTIECGGGYAQLCFSNGNSGLYYRIAWGSNERYNAWKTVTDNLNIIPLLDNHFCYGGMFADDDSVKNLNDLTPNRVHVVSLWKDVNDNIENMPDGHKHGMVMTYGKTGEGGRAQFFLSSDNRLYHRRQWGSMDDWSTWVEAGNAKFVPDSLPENPLDKVNPTPGQLGCFLHVGCIGDSLASGESTAGSGSNVQYIDIYPHSWGQYLARMTGNNYYNWSSGGRTAKSWLESQYAQECFDGEHKCEAYIIGLGQNDTGSGISVGTTADIDLANHENNADTFMGNYGKIIQKIKEIQPRARIFVLTSPESYTETYGFNDAVRELANLFDNVYLVDLHTYGQHLFQSTYIRANCRNGHYNAVAYREFALYIATYIDWIMRKNPGEFIDIEFIGTDYQP